MMKRRQEIWTLSAIFLLTLSMAWAGTRMDGSGNTIERDVVSPAGGARISTLLGSMNATAGQAAAGLSTSASGMRLYHGIHGPGYIKAASQDWHKYE
jgi:hypothetical protein